MRLTWLLAAMVPLWASPALAQDAPPDDPAMQAARAEFEEAQTLYVKEQWDGAAAKFMSAYEKKPFAAFLFNAAVAYEKGERWELAIDFFKQYVAKHPDSPDGRVVSLRIEGLERILAAQKPAQPGQVQPDEGPTSVAMLPAIETKGLVIIDSKPHGATVYLDDKHSAPLGVTRWEGSLAPRPVKVIIEAKGFKPETRQINPRPDKIVDLYVALSEEHFLGWLEVVSNIAGAEVFLDSKEKGAIGKTPFSGHVKPGKHAVWVERAGYEGVQMEIEVSPGTANTHQFTLNKVGVGWIDVPGKNTRGARLLVDGVFACNAPCEHAVKPGPHRVALEQVGMENYETTLQVEQAVKSQVNVRFSPRPPRTQAWTAAVLTAVFVGGGIYAGLQFKDRDEGIRNDVTSGKILIDNGDARVGEGKLFGIGANVAFGLATLTGIMAIYNFVKSGPPSTGEVNETNVAVAPVPMAGGAGVAASGRF